MITIGYNQVQEKHVTDGSGAASEAKKVYVGNKLAHVHVNDNTEFALRQTLNGYIHEDNDLYAKISKIKGNTKVWNQLVQNPTFVDSSNWTPMNGTMVVSNNECNLTVGGTVAISSARIQQNLNTINGHVYCLCCHINPVKNTMFTWGVSAQLSIYRQSMVAATWNTIKAVYKITGGDSNILYLYSNSDGQLVEGDVVKYRNVNLYDLTLIYGAGNEPTTVAEFEADFQKWFGRPIGAEPYDAGSLIPFIGTGIKSTGFNLWDEEWEVGGINSSGRDTTDTDKIRSANYIKVLPNTIYYFKCPKRIVVHFYDNDKTWISATDGFNNNTFTIPNNAVYIRFRTVTDYGATYNHDICINLSNPTLNGTYVPYKATTVPIPVTTLTGKQSGSSTSEIIFPDGMKLAGSVKDEVYVEDGKTYAVKRVGSVNMGDLPWKLYTNSKFLAFDVPNISPTVDTTIIANIICPIYVTVSRTNIDAYNKAICFNTSDYNYISVKDSAYTDINSFKAAMSGVMLYYELATPIVYEVDNYTLPLYYLANGTGTEEIVSTATSAPANMDIEYRLRQRVRLVDMGTPGVLWADSDIDITKPDGFCDSPFTYDKSFFSWGNVVGHNPISNTAFDYDWGGVNQAEPWYEGQVYGSTPGSTLTGNIPADAQYDAAKAVLGGNWRMPSSSNYDNLFSICKFLEADGSDMDTSKTDKRVDMPDGNGGTVKGIYIESTITGNRLFFSCSGLGQNLLWAAVGLGGYYWSSTLNSLSNAYNLYIVPGGVFPMNNFSRHYGFPIRPVFPISQ